MKMEKRLPVVPEGMISNIIPNMDQNIGAVVGLKEWVPMDMMQMGI